MQWSGITYFFLHSVSRSRSQYLQHSTFGMLWSESSSAWDYWPSFVFSNQPDIRVTTTWTSPMTLLPLRVLLVTYFSFLTSHPFHYLISTESAFCPPYGSLVLNLFYFIESTRTFMTTLDVALVDLCDQLVWYYPHCFLYSFWSSILSKHFCYCESYPSIVFWASASRPQHMTREQAQKLAGSL